MCRACIVTWILILGTTLTVVLHMFDINSICHLAIVANLIQIFSHYIKSSRTPESMLLDKHWRSGWTKTQKSYLLKHAESHLKSHDNWLLQNILCDLSAYAVILFVFGTGVHVASLVQIAPEFMKISCPSFPTF